MLQMDKEACVHRDIFAVQQKDLVVFILGRSRVTASETSLSQNEHQ